MKNPASNSNALRKETGHTLFMYGLWIRIGFVGASGVLAGLLLLFDAESKAGTALVVLLGGAVLAAMSWWKMRAIFVHLDGHETGAAELPSPASAASAHSAPQAASMEAIAR